MTGEIHMPKSPHREPRGVGAAPAGAGLDELIPEAGLEDLSAPAVTFLNKG